MEIQELTKRLGVTYVVDIEPTKHWTHYPMKPIGVTLHNAATTASGANVHNYNKYSIRTSGDGVKSWHISVGEDGAYQALGLDINGWHAGDGAGDGNLKTIGIEIARDLNDDPHLYAKAEDNALRVAAALLVYFGLTIDDLYKHQDWSGKYCPHRILRENRWDSVKHRVKTYMDMLTAEPEPEPEQEEKIYRVQVGAFSKKSGALVAKDAIAQIFKLPDAQKILKEIGMEKTEPFIP